MSPFVTLWLVLKKTLRHCLFLGLVLLSPGCSPDDNDAVPSVLRIGVLPDEEDVALRYRYAPLIAYLETELKKDTQLVIPENYDDLVRLFGAGELDIAYFGGTTFVTSLIRYDAVPLVMRDIDAEFSTYFLAKMEDVGKEIESYRGRRFSFGAQSSTSGHMMPRFFMQEKGITPETFFTEIRYSGAHDKTVRWVLDGSVDLGAANSEVVNSMLRNGRLKPGLLRIVWETPSYADYVWAARGDLDETLKNRLQEAFLTLSLLDETGAEVLERVGATGFLPARHEDFGQLRQIMTSLPHFREMIGVSAP